MSIEEDLKVLETKVNQLKMAYERYFLGTRPREPITERSEIQKTIMFFSNTAIQNTAMRFKFSSINSRYQAHKRQWNETLRKIEEGTYSRHRFKANLRESQAPPAPAQKSRPTGVPADSAELYDSYIAARRSCGQTIKNFSPERLKATLAKQEAALRQRFGNSEIRFRVVVEDGKAKLKASRGS